MKKGFAIVLCLMLALPLAAFAQQAELDTELEGFVTEIVEGGFLMEDAELGQILLNVDETTVMEGILAEEELQVGEYVIVQYNGAVTRSIPPQAHADKVGCYVLTGTVGGFLEDGIMLEGDEVFGNVIVHVQGSDKHIYSGVPITVYYDGIMAMSYPGQVSARCVIVPELRGTVSDKDSEGFTLTDADGNPYRVLIAQESLIGELVAAEEEPLTEEAEQTETAETTETTEDTAAPAEEAANDAQAAQLEEGAEAPENARLVYGFDTVDLGRELADGDRVIVYYNGQMTRSIPAQVTALEVIVLKDGE